jgi:hypothetical protein
VIVSVFVGGFAKPWTVWEDDGGALWQYKTSEGPQTARAVLGFDPTQPQLQRASADDGASTRGNDGSGSGHVRGENRAIRDAAREAGLNAEGRRALGRLVEEEKKTQGRSGSATLPYREIRDLAKELARTPRYRDR